MGMHCGDIAIAWRLAGADRPDRFIGDGGIFGGGSPGTLPAIWRAQM